MKFRYLPLAAVVMASHAVDAANPRHDLEEVIVSASPIHAQHSDNARAISVLNGDQLRTQASATLSQTLTGQLGVSASSFGAGVGNPIIRGQSANRVKVMQDNLDTLDASNTSADHANTTEPLLADQIEILRGPSTLRFGGGAIGGVVNVIDGRIPTQLQDKDGVRGAVETRYSSVNDESASVVRVDGQSGNFAWHADGLYRDSNDVEIDGLSNPEDPEDSSDGFIENSNARAHAYSIGGSWIGENGYIGLSINEQENNYGIPPGAHEHHHHEDHGDDDHDEEGEIIRIDMEQTRYDLKAQLNEPFAGWEKIQVRIGHNDYEHVELEGADVGTTYESDAWESRIEMVHNPINNWQGAIGIQHLDRDYGADGDEAFIPSDSQIRNTGIFWIEEKHWDHQWLELGLRYERQTIDPDNQASVDHTATSFSFGYHWSLEDVHNFSIVASHAERAPSLEELFADGAHIATQTFDLGNADLDEEVSNNLDLGYQWKPEGEGLVRDLKVNVFYNQISDYIYQFDTEIEDVESELIIFEYRQDDADFHGLEVEANLALTEQLGLRLFGDAVRAEFDDNSDVPRMSPDRIGAELSFEQPGWFGSIQLIEVSEQDRVAEEETKTDGYTRLNAEINVPLSLGTTDGMVFVRADNLLDEEIRHSTSFLKEVAPEAGRSLTAGIRLSF